MRCTVNIDKYLCIVGSGITRDLVPFDDPNCIVWTTASVAVNIKHVHLAFEMHNDVYTPEHLNSLNVDEFMLMKAMPSVHNSTRLPIEKLEETYGKIFPGSMSMILAWAAYTGWTKVYLYGIDLTADSEYAKQRYFFIYLVGLLRGQGIEIIISAGSGLNDECETYIQDQPRDAAMHVIKKTAIADIAKWEGIINDAKERLLYTRGFLEAVEIQERSKHHGSYRRV